MTTYQNFYMKDIRTPETYYENRNVSKEQSLEQIKGRLDDLLSVLDALEERTKQPTPAYKKILEDEIDNAVTQRYKKQSKENAKKVMEAITYGTHSDAIEAINHAIDYKIFCRTEPYMVEAGETIENQVFRTE
jgi:hypothetical protein